MITRRKDGYHVIAKGSGRSLGGPYKTRGEAVQRLAQVEYFRHKGKGKK